VAVYYSPYHGIAAVATALLKALPRGVAGPLSGPLGGALAVVAAAWILPLSVLGSVRTVLGEGVHFLAEKLRTFASVVASPFRRFSRITEIE